VHDALLTLKFCKAISSTRDIALTTKKIITQKEKTPCNSSKPQTNQSFMTTLYVENRKLQKALRETPPLSPAASHTPPAEMKYTWGAAVLVQDFTTRWRAGGEHLSN
jgi:hypothetical protein